MKSKPLANMLPVWASVGSFVWLMIPLMRMLLIQMKTETDAKEEQEQDSLHVMHLKLYILFNSVNNCVVRTL